MKKITCISAITHGKGEIQELVFDNSCLESAVQSCSPGRIPGYPLKFKVNVGFTPAALCFVLAPESEHSLYSLGSRFFGASLHVALFLHRLVQQKGFYIASTFWG